MLHSARSILLCFLLCLMSYTLTYAQQGNNCREELDEANALYTVGRFDETIVLIDQCLEKTGIPDADQRFAYRLKGLSYIGKGLEGDARASIRLLLTLVPNYEPDPIQDPPDFVSLVQELKDEMGISNSSNRVTYSAGSRTNSPDRSGFTLLLNIGVGFQDDELLEESATGLGGLNLGIGGFISDNVALMVRISGTSVTYEIDVIGISGEFSQTSGVVALSAQYWVNDSFYIEGGPGIGFFDFNSGDETDRSFGLLLGAGYTVFNSGRNNIQIGIEYAPAFIEEGQINNFGITIGYQLL